MTRVLFLPDDQTVILLDTPLTHAGLVCMVGDGSWKPPHPFENLAGPLRLLDQGRMVIILGPDALLPPGENSALLNPVEREIIQALADGLRLREIAGRLGLHRRTVDWHIAHLKRRLGAATNQQLVTHAAALGFCTLSPPR